MAVALRWKKVRQRRSAAGSFCALNSPGLSCYPTGYCEIAPAVELSRTWRSGSAATVKSVSTHVRRCPVHLGRPLLRLPRRFAPRNDKSGAITVLTGACTSRQRCAGSGMPLPYNSGCGRRNCFKICNCQWRSGSAATDAIGLYVFVGSPFESAAVRRAGLSPPIQHLTILQRHYFT